MARRLTTAQETELAWFLDTCREGVGELRDGRVRGSLVRAGLAIELPERRDGWPVVRLTEQGQKLLIETFGVPAAEALGLPAPRLYCVTYRAVAYVMAASPEKACETGIAVLSDGSYGAAEMGTARLVQPGDPVAEPGWTSNCLVYGVQDLPLGKAWPLQSGDPDPTTSAPTEQEPSTPFRCPSCQRPTPEGWVHDRAFCGQLPDREARDALLAEEELAYARSLSSADYAEQRYDFSWETRAVMAEAALGQGTCE